MLRKNREWTEERINHTSDRDEIFQDCQPQLWHCPDFLIEPEDVTARNTLYENVKHNDSFAIESEFSLISIYFSGQRLQIRLWLQCRIGRYRYIYYFSFIIIIFLNVELNADLFGF